MGDIYAFFFSKGIVIASETTKGLNWFFTTVDPVRV